MFFELAVLGIILLAAGYWAAMFAMGRRGDVLHGKFIEDSGVEPPANAMPRPNPDLNDATRA